MDTIINVIAVFVGFAGGAWTAGRQADRDRHIRGRDTAIALIADMDRIVAMLGPGTGAPNLVVGTPITRRPVPRIHRWVDGLVVSIAAEHPQIMPLFLEVDAHLEELLSAADAFHEVCEYERKALAACAELDEAKASNWEAEVEMEALTTLTPAEEDGDTSRFREAVAAERQWVQTVGEAEAVAARWTKVRQLRQGQIHTLGTLVRLKIDGLQDVLLPIAARPPLPMLPVYAWRRHRPAAVLGTSSLGGSEHMHEQRPAPMPAVGDIAHWADGRTAAITESLGGAPGANIWMVDTDHGRVIVTWSWDRQRYIVDDR